MERQMSLFGIADFVVKQNRGKAMFLDGVSAMINWKRIETVLHRVICRFRNLLVSKGVLKQLVDEINGQMEKQGNLVKKGIAVGASIIRSAASP